MTVTLAESPTEETFAEVLAELVSVEQVPADSHFFDDLGADSMVMAQFCARVRKRGDLPPVSMKDIYEHPTIRSLATSLTDDTAAGATSPADDTAVATSPADEAAGATSPADQTGAPVESPAPAPAEPATPPGTLQYVVTGVLQFLAFLAYMYGAAVVIAAGYQWMSAGSGAIDVYLRAVAFGGATFLGVCVLPIVAKWTLVGRWKRGQIRVWSLAYFRFWLVKTLVQRNPLVLFAGSPLYVLYLRALGAKVGRGAVIFSRRVPVCTDLLTVGEGTVIHKDSFFTCYRAHASQIQTGAVTLGKNVVVGETAVLDIETSIGDGAQLAHTSSLHEGQSIPAGERRQGSPAEQRTEVDLGAVEPLATGTARRVVYSALQLLRILALSLPLAIGGLTMLIAEVPQLTAIVDSGSLALTSWTFYASALAASFVLFFGFLLVGLLVVLTVPRLLNRFIEPDRVYRLYGFHYGVHRAIERMTNVAFFPRILGDSSYIVPYLRWLGYDMPDVEQTGSNFGLEVKHENPFLCTIGSGTISADGLSIINADFSSTSFRVSRATIGARSFLGNYIAYPSQSKVGDNCLLATKAIVPVDGEVREGVGLLGSPSFEIPRSVQRDSRFDHLERGEEKRRRLAAKNRHNAVTIGLFLLAWWIFVFGTTVLSWAAADLYGSVGAVAVALAGVLILVLRVGHFTLLERLGTMFRHLEPQYCSIYEPYFWWHERFWKLAWQPLILDGTPFKNLTWRLLGVRLGKRVFDDGCAIVEKTLVTIGDDCTLNVRSIVQPHSQEDGTFKSDRIAIGARCTLGIASLVHYGATMGDDVALAPDSFLMKGEEVPARSRWAGNPAREARDELSAGVPVAAMRRG